MSYEARNAGTDGLGVFNIIAEVYGSGGVYIESSPIYTTLDRTWSISGSYEDATYEYDYDYSITLPQLTREAMSTAINSIAPMVTSGFFSGDTLSADFAEYGTVGTNKMYMAMSPALRAEYSVYYSPLYQTFDIIGGSFNQSGVVVGTRTKKSDSSTTDLILNLTIQAPYFISGFTGYRAYPAQLVFPATKISSSDVDITSYTVAQWRDFRGVYEFESTDGNGITTTAFWTIGGGMGLDFSSAYNSSQLILI